MANDLIRYDQRVQDALRGVIRKVLAEAAKDGLPGEHHFQIAFRTDAPGVRLSMQMRQRFPQEMTIILQYQFRELSVTDQHVEVVLFFNHIPERITIPFEAISGFFDPSVDFGLRFDVQADNKPESPAKPAATGPRLVPATPARVSGDAADVPRTRGAASEPVEFKPARPPQSVAKPTAADKLATSIAEGKGAEPAKSGDGKIVSIDAFRRKP